MNTRIAFSRLRASSQLLTLLALTAVAPALALAERSTVRFAPEAIREQVKYLTSDALRGRGSGDIGNDKAAQYVAREFAKIGLKPLGTDRQRDPDAALDGKGYFQPFTFAAGRAVGKGNKLTLEVEGKAWNLRPSTEFEPSGVSGGGKAERSGAVWVGYGIAAPRLNHDDYKAAEVKGKVVVMLAGYPGGASDSPLRDFADVGRKAREARDRGATAALVVLPRNQGEFPRTPFEFAFIGDAGIPVLRVKYPALEKWVAAGGRNLDELAAAALRGPIERALPLAGSVRLAADVTRVEKVTANVLGLLEGSDPTLKDEVVVIGAHMDHLGLGGPGSLSPSAKPDIHHGADDNASGTAGMLQLARHFAANRPKRSLLFMAFSGEELGLLGSAHYTRKPVLPLARTAAMLNMDMIGRLKDNKLTVSGIGSAEEWGKLVDSAISGSGLTVGRSDDPFGSSDHASFYAAGIPVLFFFTGLHDDYHRPSDTWDKINYEGMAQVLTFAADCAARVADASARPTFRKMEQPNPNSGSRRFSVYLGSVPSYSETVEGVLLEGVREGSPAEKAGMKAGDIIIRFADKAVKNIQDYVNALTSFQPGDKVAVTVLRDGREVVLNVTLAARSRE